MFQRPAIRLQTLKQHTLRKHSILLQLTHLLPSAAHPSSILGQNFSCCFLASPRLLCESKVVVGTHINDVLYHSPRVPVSKPPQVRTPTIKKIIQSNYTRRLLFQSPRTCTAVLKINRTKHYSSSAPHYETDQ